MDRDEYLDKVFAGILDILVPPERLKNKEEIKPKKHDDDGDDQPDLHDLFV